MFSPAGLRPSILARRALLRGLFVSPLAFWAAACGKSAATAPLPSVSLSALPSGLGRGFPLGTLIGADNSSTGIDIGQTAPNFRLQIRDDMGLYLSDLTGHPVLINFWATWCGPCRLEMPAIIQHATSNPDLVVLAINVQEAQEPIAAFAGDFKMTMPVVRDVDAKIRDLYEVRGMPTSVFVDRAGKVSTYRMGVMSPRVLEELLTPIL